MTPYAKLKDLTLFSVKAVLGIDWQKWNEATRKFEKQQDWFQGADKVYTLAIFVDGQEMKLSVSKSQMAQMLEGVCYMGKSDITNKEFSVKTVTRDDGKSNYYINPIRVGGYTTGGAPVGATQSPLNASESVPNAGGAVVYQNEPQEPYIDVESLPF